MENNLLTNSQVPEDNAERFIGPVVFNLVDTSLDSSLRTVYEELPPPDQEIMRRTYANFDPASQAETMALQGEFMRLNPDQQKEFLGNLHREEIFGIIVETIKMVGKPRSAEREDARDLLNAYLGFAHNIRLRGSRSIGSRYFPTTISDSHPSSEMETPPYQMVYLYEQLVRQKQKQNELNSMTVGPDRIIDPSDTGQYIEELCRAYLTEMTVMPRRDGFIAAEVEAKKEFADDHFLSLLRAHVLKSGEAALFASPGLLEGLLQSLKPKEDQLVVDSWGQGGEGRARQIKKASDLLSEIVESGSEVYIDLKVDNSTEEAKQVGKEGWLVDAVIIQNGSRTIRLGPLRGIRGFNESNAAIELELDNSNNIALRKLPAGFKLTVVETKKVKEII